MSLLDERKDLNAAADGLRQWFASQDINPTDALFVMVNLLVRQTLAVASKDPDPVRGLMKLRGFPALVETAVKNETSFVVHEELIRLAKELKVPQEVIDNLIKAFKP